NLFSIPFGITGLATAWAYAAHRGLATPIVCDVLCLIAAMAWLAVLSAFLRAVSWRPRAATGDLADPVLGPFGSIALIVPLLLTVDALLPRAPGAARVIVDVLVAAIVALGGWYTGQWIYRPVAIDKLHPGYLLPTVAGGLLAAAAAGACGDIGLGQTLFGLGMICWLIIGSMVLVRLLFWPPLPAPLTPTIAIEIAPAAAATLAYLSIHGDHINAVAAGLGGYGLLMALAQIRLLPAYRRLAFGLGFWAFTFSWAIVTTAGLHWLADQHPAGWRTWSYLVLAAITLLVGAIAARTVIALRRGQLLPAPPASAPDDETTPAADLARSNVLVS
ncbi:MAG: hypothetical protein JO304_01015, partial [Solirubrobacterales bacterium]|nr:hypothetical protein [Solirubrobacterales bacterium]